MSRIRVRPTIRTVARLDPFEVYRAQAFHAGHLWLGHSSGTVDDYRVDVHDPDGRVVASGAVRHTVEFLHPFAPRAVLAVGKHFVAGRGWRTFHSVASLGPRGLRVRTRTMPARYQVEQFGGSPRAMFFNETGLGRVIRWNGFWARPLPAPVRFPGTLLHCGRWLFVLERNDFRPGQESIARIDLRRGTLERTFPRPRRRLTTIVDLPGLPWIAAPEAWADRVLLVDKAANRLAAEIPVAGTPVELARVGDCLVVASQEPARLSFVHLRRPGFPIVAEWDLSATGTDLGNIRAMDVDPVTGDVYLRSPYHARVADNTPAVTVVGDPDGATRAACGIVGPAPHSASETRTISSSLRTNTLRSA